MENPNRVKILSLLAETPMERKAIHEKLRTKKSQQSLDFHLAKLVRAKLIYVKLRVPEGPRDRGLKGFLYCLNEANYSSLKQAIDILNFQ